MSSYAQCFNAGLRCCGDCRRNVDNNPPATRTEYQVFVAASTSDRCAHWLAIPVRKGAEQKRA